MPTTTNRIYRLFIQGVDDCFYVKENGRYLTELEVQENRRQTEILNETQPSHGTIKEAYFEKPKDLKSTGLTLKIEGYQISLRIKSI